MKSKFFVILALLALGLVAMLWLRSRDHSEYDEQLYIDSAINYYVNDFQKRKTSFTNPDGTEGVAFLPYTSHEGFLQKTPAYISVVDFLEHNPECCLFSYRGGEGHLPSWFQRMSNNYEGVVTLTDKRRRVIDGNLAEHTFQFEIQMNSDTSPILPIINLYVQGN